MADYSSNERYWQRRHIAEALFKRADESVPRVGDLKKKLKKLNKKILVLSQSVKFRCVYAVREDPRVDFESGADGGYCDSWWRSYPFSLSVCEDLTEEEFNESSEENEVPTPGKPITVYLERSSPQYTPEKEWIKCIHPDCCEETEPYRRSYFSDNKVIFLFCRRHATNKRIQIIEDFIMKGKEIVDPAIKEMVDTHLRKLTEFLHSSYLNAIKNAEDFLENDEEPDKVLEINCDPEPETKVEEPEEVTVYVDLIDCKIIQR